MLTKTLYLFLLLSLPCVAQSSSWLDWWQSKDQQGYKLLTKKQYKEASETFKEPSWKAASHYRAKNYKQAAKDFAQQKNYYNQGNALAQLGKINEAISAYKKTLKDHPNHQDAQHNLNILEELKQQEEQKQNQQGEKQQDGEQQDSEQQNEEKQSGETGEQEAQKNQQQDGQKQESSLEKDKSHLDSAKKDEKEEKEDGKSAQEKSEEEAKKEENANQQPQQNAQTGEDGAKQEQSNPQASVQEQQEGNSTAQQTQRRQLTPEEIKELEKNLNFKQWLRTLPNNNSDSLLKRKFAYQYQKRQHGNTSANSIQSKNKKW